MDKPGVCCQVYAETSEQGCVTLTGSTELWVQPLNLEELQGERVRSCVCWTTFRKPHVVENNKYKEINLGIHLQALMYTTGLLRTGLNRGRGSSWFNQ